MAGFWGKKPEHQGREAPEREWTDTPSAPPDGGDAVPESPKSALAESAPRLGSADASEVEKRLLHRFGSLRMVVCPGTVIDGKLSFDAPARIDGRLSGEVFSSKALIIGPEGMVNARIEAAEVIILGRVEGSVSASERVEILAGGCLNGEVAAPMLVMEEGAKLDGRGKIGGA